MDLLDGTVVGHICKHCLVRLVGILPPASVRAPGCKPMWLPYADDGTPLPTLPNPGHHSRR